MIFSTLIEAFATILHSVISIYIWVIIISSLLTWVKPDPHNPIVQALYKLTEPVYNIVRRRINTTFGGMDLTPIIILFALQFIDLFFIKILFNIAQSF